MKRKSAEFKNYIQDIATKASITTDPSEYKRLSGILIEELEYLIQFRVQKYKRFDNCQDLLQEGRAAILTALNSFTPEKSNFIFWANWYIKTRISREANKHSTIKIPIKKAKTIQPHKVSQEVETFFDASDGAYDEYISREIRETVWETLKTLPHMERKVLELNGIRQHSIQAIAKDLKISEIKCIKLLDHAKQNFRKQILNNDYSK